MLTEGEKRVRIDFNSQGVYNVPIHKIKTKFAEIINMLEASAKEEYDLGTYNTRVEETYKQAIIRVEDAAMWAVKAITSN